MAISQPNTKTASEREGSEWIALFASEQISSTRTLADRVSEALMRKIVGKELPAGAQLPSEQMMAASFGVSRTVVREAISRLKSEGLIDTRQGRGAFVRTDRTDVPLRLGIDATNPLPSLLHILELRLGLDAEIAALAAARRTRDQMAAIQRALKAIDHASDAGGDAVAEDLEFHLSIAQATQNPMFFELIRFLGGSFYSGIAVTRANERRMEELAKETRSEHKAIAQAVSKRDAHAAAAAARTHIENASKRLLSADADFWQNKAIQVVSTSK
ncbi:FadR/GntR family transcriptional regulator [Granulicella sp. dw_53]|uniref:FadR/GntR family transcriptional regulator n=1 Tax=Granulicella sp. dw_53 TaxID=2719792 RepID=UPI0021031C78|nr:FadR/GntR family transcriptional regulator [Granulicella sp. dw_53]